MGWCTSLCEILLFHVKTIMRNWQYVASMSKAHLSALSTTSPLNNQPSRQPALSTTSPKDTLGLWLPLGCHFLHLYMCALSNET